MSLKLTDGLSLKIAFNLRYSQTELKGLIGQKVKFMAEKVESLLGRCAQLGAIFIGFCGILMEFLFCRDLAETVPPTKGGGFQLHSSLHCVGYFGAKPYIYLAQKRQFPSPLVVGPMVVMGVVAEKKTQNIVAKSDRTVPL